MRVRVGLEGIIRAGDKKRVGEDKRELVRVRGGLELTRRVYSGLEGGRRG